MNDTLPGDVIQYIEDSLKLRISSSVVCGGGMINHAQKLNTSKGSYFIKWNPNIPSGNYTSEAHGLSLLNKSGAIRVPEVILLKEREAKFPEVPPILVLEWLEERRPKNEWLFVQNFGKALAKLHRENPASSGLFGLQEDNFLGAQPQINRQMASWTDFYRECRLLPQIDRARSKGLLPSHREKLMMNVVENLEKLLEGLSPRPTLIHGDLWSGNYLSLGEDAALIDPAVYYGEREMELAYIQLFGGFPAGLLQAYHAEYPIDPGYPARRSLHQLYPLLIHLNHFGETYGDLLDQACQDQLRRV
jgi:fructosamine-3-kinase